MIHLRGMDKKSLILIADLPEVFFMEPNIDLLK